MESSPKTSVFAWRGLFGEQPARVRRAMLAILCVAVAALVFSQLGYIEIANVRLLLVLVVVTASAFCHGVRGGLFTGLIAGAATLAHAVLLPLDYYEKYFVSPVNSIVLFALCGVLAGVLFAVMARRSRDNELNPVGVVVVCVVTSLFCSVFFLLSARVISLVAGAADLAALAAIVTDLGGTLLQVVFDALFMCVACVACCWPRWVCRRRLTLV